MEVRSDDMRARPGFTPPRRRGAGAVASLGLSPLALALLLGCAPSPPAPAGPLRLLEAGAEVTLGHETRRASGSAGTLLFREGFRLPDDLPRSVALPDEVAAGERVVLHYRAWTVSDDRLEKPLEGRQHSVAVAVEHRGPSARLRGLRRFAGRSPLTLQVTAFPLPDEPTSILRSALVPPKDALLEFGYGMREESWVPRASPTEFSVSLRDDAGASHELLRRTLDPGDPDHRRWFDARVDLGAFAGQPVTLEFTTTRKEAVRGFDLPVWSEPIVYAPAAAERPNFLVISIDTLRAQNLGAYGYGRDTSPFLDSLAAAGSLFENAITPSVTTAPSHMSLFTGLYPAGHGIQKGSERKLDHAVTLAERLSHAGYRTAAYTENGYLIRNRGFGSGFEQYTENKGEKSRAPGEVRLTFSQARSWLAENRRAPFFLFVHTYQVHSPYDPPAEYAQSFAGDGAPGPEKPILRRDRDNYDREIRLVDEEMRKLFAAPEATGWAESTIAVIVSDHGEEFGEHGRVQHGGAVFDESLRVPLVFWGPGRIPAGHRHAAQVSLIDIAPTLLELAGEEIPPSLDGRSLKGVMLDGEIMEPRTLFAEARGKRRWIGPWQVEAWSPPLVAVRSQTAKFIVHRPVAGDAEPTVRYDLAQDPVESSPQLVDAEQAESLRALVDDHLSGGAGSTAPGAHHEPDQFSPDLKERLRRLGYLE